MNSMKFPKPTGFEIIKVCNGENFTLKQIVTIKKKISSIITHAKESISNNQNDTINVNNLIDYVIMYEYYRYTDIVQPTNLLDFFSHILNLYCSINVEDSVVLDESQFNKLDKCNYKDINTYFQNTTIEPSTKCPICRESYSENSHNIILPCKHNFHVDCVDRWLLKESNLCPICKQEVT